MTFTINKEYSELKIKIPRNSAKTCPKLTKITKASIRNGRHCCGIPPCCQIWTGPTPYAKLLVYTLKRHLCVELTLTKGYNKP